MGGNIGVTIRTAEGIEYRMQRWTNSLPGFINSPSFFDEGEKGDDHLAIYLHQWVMMRADWEQNRHTSKFKLNMTSVYWPWPDLLAPSEYGIVVIDYQTKTIISCNYYCTPGRMHRPHSSEKYPEGKWCWRWFKEKGMIKESTIGGKGGLTIGTINLPKLGWKLLEFENPKELPQARKSIEQLGFKLTKEDRAEWNNSVK